MGGQNIFDAAYATNQRYPDGLGISNSRPFEPLGELHYNQRDQASRSPKKQQDEDRQASPSRRGFATLSSKSRSIRDSAKLSKSRENSPKKPKKPKSSTNLAGLLSRPKSIKNLRKFLDEEASRAAKDKENRSPQEPEPESSVLPPIYAQFASQPFQEAQSNSSAGGIPDSSRSHTGRTGHPEGSAAQGAVKTVPKPMQAAKISKQDSRALSAYDATRRQQAVEDKTRRRQTWAKGATVARQGTMLPFGKKSELQEVPEPYIDPKDIDMHLEALLDRRNIPENQRYKMRNLSDTIKMEFIRQDWAETQAAKADKPSSSHSNDVQNEIPATPLDDGTDSKKKKHRSLTLHRNAVDKSSPSPTKKQRSAAATLGRHFRTKSTESIGSDRPSSSLSSSSTGILSKIMGQKGPMDFVTYLREFQKPEVVEVGKLHKLRLLLRNETVSWTEEFMRQGGMKEIVHLLYRIMDVEWR
jgi:hypothetical protein